LQPGAIADLTLLAPQQPWTLDASTLLSAGRNTPFSGHRFATRVICTLRAGEPVAGTLPAFA
jgi:dihydroorotase